MFKKWYLGLSKYEKLVFGVSKLTKGIYWTKNHKFSGGIGYYSDPISDNYWTLITQLTVNKKGVDNFTEEVDEFFSKLKKRYGYYVYPSDRKNGIEKLIKEKGFKLAFEDSWMFYQINEPIDLQIANPRITLKEVKTIHDNEVYIETYTKAYETNRDDVYFNFAGNGIYQEIYRKTWKNKTLCKKMHRFIAFYEGAPVSIGVLYFKDKLGYISEVGTDPRYRKKGLARVISTSCLKVAQIEGCNTVCLATETNSPAFRLYRSLGFTSQVICRGWSKK